jgi:hypothetical protein
LRVTELRSVSVFPAVGGPARTAFWRIVLARRATLVDTA